MKEQYDFIRKELNGLTPEDHFWALLSRHEEFEDSISLLKQWIDSRGCEMNEILQSLDAIALVCKPFIDFEEGEWKFDGVDTATFERMKQNGEFLDVKSTLRFITDLYPYIQQRWQTLK